MRNVMLALLGLLVAGLGLAGPAAARTPVVVELFTSQGCSSCVKSGEMVEALAGKRDVLALTFAVDYWDYLGWEDTFAKPEFAERQRAYMKRFALRDVYTPQLVIDGQAQAAAVHEDTVEDMVKAAERVRHRSLDLTLAKGRVSVGAGEATRGGADVWLVRYDPRVQSVKVTRGENRGKIIVAHNVVRQLVRLGGWTGSRRSFHVPEPESDGLKTVVLVQAAHGGKIIGARLF